MFKFFLVSLFVASTALGVYFLWPQYLENRALAEQLDEAQQQVVINQQEIDRRRQMIDDLNNNSDAVARIAREKFGWCRPGERVYKFTDEELLESENED